MSTKSEKGPSWDQADFECQASFLEKQIGAMESVMAATGRTVPTRPDTSKADVIEVCDMLEAHAGKLQALCRTAGAKVPPGPTSPAATSPARASIAPATTTRATSPTATTPKPELTATDKARAAKGGNPISVSKEPTGATRAALIAQGKIKA